MRYKPLETLFRPGDAGRSPRRHPWSGDSRSGSRPAATRQNGAKGFLPTLLFTALITACGGGGGSPTTTPITPPGIFPIDPVEEPRAESTARVVLQSGVVADDGFVTGTIEDAALGEDGAMAVIAEIAEGEERAILIVPLDAPPQRVPGLDRLSVDVTTLSRLRQASTGELAFRSGNGLDTDQLHVLVGNSIRTIAGADGVGAPDFRVLGNYRIGAEGRVAFASGGGECETQQNGETTRDLCTVALFFFDGEEVFRLDHPDLELDRRQAIDVRIALSETGRAAFSVPARGASPAVLRSGPDGQLEPLLRNRSEVEGQGILARVDLVDVDSGGRILVELGPEPETEDSPIEDRLGFLDADGFVPIAQEGLTLDDRRVASLRGLGIAAGRALFEAEVEDATTPEPFACLYLGDTRETEKILCEGDSFPGESLKVFAISGNRVNPSGDLLTVLVLGTTDEATTRIEEIRAVVRRTDREWVTIASSKDADRLGTITELISVGLDSMGNALLIAERSRASDRALLLGSSYD